VFAFNSLVFDSYPWSHSFVMAMVWGVALAAIARWRGIAASAAVLIAFLAVSHVERFGGQMVYREGSGRAGSGSFLG
jgi:hypothetical protein